MRERTLRHQDFMASLPEPSVELLVLARGMKQSCVDDLCRCCAAAEPASNLEVDESCALEAVEFQAVAEPSRDLVGEHTSGEPRGDLVTKGLVRHLKLYRQAQEYLPILAPVVAVAT